MTNHTIQKQLSVLCLVFFLVGLSGCGFKSQQPSQAASANSGDRPIGTGATPEPGNDGKPAPRPDGHAQSIVEANGIAYIGSDNGTLYAVNASDGAVRWQQALGSFVAVSAVMNGTVYVSIDGSVVAFDAASGARRWQQPISGLTSGSAMMFDAGTLFVAATVPHNNNAHAIYALKTTDGSQLWQYTSAALTPILSGVKNGVVYSLEITGDFLTGDQSISALRASDGHLLWRMHIENTDGRVLGNPGEADGIVYFTTNSDAIYALRVATGTIVWHIAAPIQWHGPAVGTTPVTITDGVVYVNTRQGVLALQASTGTLLWEKKMPSSPSPFFSQPVVSNGRIYVVSNSGVIFALRVQDGSQIWQVTDDSISNPFTVEDGLIYVNASEKIDALHLQDGSLAWRQPLDHHAIFSSSDTSMLVADGMIYASKDSGVVQALRASDGKSLWSYTIQEQAVPTDFAYGASVMFASSVSYQQALKVLADLGLRVGIFCPTMWKPQLDGSVFSDHSLAVVANVNSAPLWLTRLKATVGVQDIQVVGAHSCPMMRLNSDSSRLPFQQSGTFLQVTFSSTVSYSNALEAVNNLWFRMADPCYEQARAQGTKPTWHKQGQADTFAHTHSFVLATTGLNSIHWLAQLHAVAGVVKVDAPLKMNC